MKSKTAIKTGDIVSIPTEDGKAVVYVHFLGANDDYGDAVAVSPREHAPGTPADASLFADAYPVFFPVSMVVQEKLGQVAGNVRSPGVPKKWRRPGAREGTSIKSWVIEGGWREVVRKELSEEEKSLPIAGVWNIAMLLSRVKEGWRPEKVTS